MSAGKIKKFDEFLTSGFLGDRLGSPCMLLDLSVCPVCNVGCIVAKRLDGLGCYLVWRSALAQATLC